VEFLLFQMKNDMDKNIKIEESKEKEHFDVMAEIYEKKYGYFDKFTKYKMNKKVNSFISLLNAEYSTLSNLRIIEIGCGTGIYTVKYAQKMPKTSVLATDISDGMVRIAEERKYRGNNLKYKVVSAYNTGLEDSSVDVVCGFYILHHLNSKAVIKEIRRILKPGGLIYFYEPNILNPVVFMIKSNKFIKMMVGDSSEEWAINPTKISSQWIGFKPLEIKTTEFVWPVSFIPYGIKVFLDKFTSYIFTQIPGINLLGGSVELFLRKKEQ
jgi:ubiquinone/menaquinone biosynthesis C-methylase UbiE